MAEEQFKIGAFIQLEGEADFTNKLKKVNSDIRGLKNELDLVKETYAGNLNSLEALSKKQEIYGRMQTEISNKIERIKEGQKHANEVFEKYSQKISVVQTKLDEARNKLDEMRESGTASADAVNRQTNEVEELEKALEKANTRLTSQEARISAWRANLSRAEAQQARLNNQIEENIRYLEEARHSTDHHSHSIDGNARIVRQTTEVIVEWGEALKGAVADKAIDAGIDAVKELGNAAVDTARELQKAENQLDASLELSVTALERYKDILGNIYRDNYGDSLEDVGGAISSTVQILGELDGMELQKVVESAFTLRDTFGMDMDETLRGTKSLMYQFGMTAEEAMDLIGSGARNGLNYTDELGDNLSEYAGKFAQAGYSAKEYFQLLENGTSNGAYNLDKVNDAINEVTTRLADGTVEGSLDTYSNGTRRLFRAWQEGEATQKQVIDSIVEDIAGCKNQQQALNMAAQAFGTMAEDGNLTFISSLTSVGNAFDDVQGKMDEIKNTKYDDLNSQISGISRTIQMQIGEQIEKLLPFAVNGLHGISDNLDIIESGIIGLGTSIGLIKLGTSSALMGLTAWWRGLQGANVATKILTASTEIMDGVMTFTQAHWKALALGIIAATAVFMALSHSLDTTNIKIRESRDYYKELTKEIEKNRTAREENTGVVESEYSSYSSLITQLYNMTDAERTSTEGKAKAAAMVATLNEKISGLNLQIDETTGKLNMEKSALDEVIKSMEKQALAEAAQGALKEVASERIELMRQRQEAIDNINELSAKHAAGNSVEQTVISKQMREQQKVIQGLNEQLNKNAEEFDDLSEMAGEYVDAAEDATEATRDYAETSAEVEASADAQKKAMQSLKEKYEEVRSSIQKSMEDKISLFDMFDGGKEIGLGKMEENLESQLKGLTEWKDNMTKLAAQVGNGISAELFDYLVSLGPSGANAVKEMAAAIDPETGEVGDTLKRISEKYGLVFDFSEKAAEGLGRTAFVIEAALGKISESSDIDFDNLISSLDGAVEAAAESGTSISRELQDAFTETVEAARSCGVEIPDGMAESIANGEMSLSEAISQLKGGMIAQFDYLAQLAAEAGINVPEELRQGIESGGQNAEAAMGKLIELLTGAQEKARQEFEKSGKENTKAVGSGTESAKPEVVSKTQDVMQQSVTAANSFSTQFRKAGYDMMLGVAAGIKGGTFRVVEEVRKTMQTSVDEANKYNKVNSPSRLWRDKVGMPISEGIAAGIGNGRKDVISASVELAKSALGATKEELEIHSPSDKFKKQVGRQIASGVAFGIREGKGEAKKSAKELAKEVADAAKSWLEEKKKTGNLTVEEENFMWNRLIRTAGKQGKAYKAQLKKLAKEAKKEIAEESKEYGVSGAALDLYKTFGDVSAKAEIQYWEKVRESKGLTKAQLLEIDKKIIEAQRSYNDQLKDLEDDYLEKCQEVRKQLDADRKEAQEEYENTFKERKKTIREAFGLFDEFRSEAESPEKLLANMQSQVMGYTLWMEQLEELEGKGILDGGFIEELRQMGPAAAATIISMNSATDEQLRLMNESYLKKNELSESQAAKETEALRVATEKKIAELEKAAQAEMDKYKEEYEKAAAELSAAISKPLEDLAGKATTLGENATTKLILGMTEAAKSKETKAGTGGVKREIVQQMSNLPAKGKSIGKNTLAGILEGLSNKLEIQKGAESFVKELEAAIKKAAGIASPSRRFKEIVGKQIPAGVAAGIEENTQTATDAGTGMIQQMLDQAAEQAKQQQAVLADYAAGLNGSAGIVALNTLVETPAAPAANVTVNNTGVANMIAGLTAEMQTMCDEIRRMKVVFDDGTLIGRISTGVGEQLAMDVRRW